MAERRDEARLVFRILFKVNEGLDSTQGFFLAIPFNLKDREKGLIHGTQESLLDHSKNTEINLYIEIRKTKYTYSHIEGRKIVLKNDDESVSVYVLRESDFVVAEASFKEYEASAENVRAPVSLLHVVFNKSLDEGYYIIKFYCYIKDFLGKIADYWMFQEGKILEASVLNSTGIGEQILPDDCSEIPLDYLELFLVTPSNVVVSSVSPEGFKSQIYTEEEEANLGTVSDRVDPAEIDYKPYRGRYQFKWVFTPQSEKRYVSLLYWPSSTAPVLLLIGMLLLNFLGILFLISSAERLLEVTTITFLMLLLIFDSFMYFSIRKPVIIQKTFLFIRIIGISRIVDQVLGSTLVFILISLFAMLFGEYLKQGIPEIWISLVLVLLLLILLVDARFIPDLTMKSFRKTLVQRNIIVFAASLVLSILAFNLIFYLVAPAWSRNESILFFLILFSLIAGAGKISDMIGARKDSWR